MVSWGLSKTKPGIPEWNVVLSNSVFEQCDVKRTKWKRKERNGSSGNQHAQLKKDSIDNSAVLQLLIYSFNTTIRVGKWSASSKCNVEIADCVAEIELNVRFCVEQN